MNRAPCWDEHNVPESLRNAWARARACVGVAAASLTLLVAVAVALGGCGCSPTPGAKNPPRDVARAVVVTLAKATASADQLCASIAMAQKDAKIAKACADSYDVARPALLAAESAVDGWESGESGRVACLVVDASLALGKTVETISAAGGKVPLDVGDALQFARSIAGVCRRG